MLSRDEYHEAVGLNGDLYILCERLDMFPDIEKELLSGKTISYQCESMKESAVRWRKMYQDLTKSTFSVASTVTANKGGWVLCHTQLICQHYSRAKMGKKRRPSPRDTGCPVRLHIRVRRVALAKNAKSRSTKPDAGYALKVQSNGVAHNHSTEAVLRHRRVSDATRLRVIELLAQLRSPVRAFDALKDELQAQYGDRFPDVAADGAVLPSLRYMYATNKKLFGEVPRSARKRRWAVRPRPEAEKRPCSAPIPATHSVGGVSGGTLGLVDLRMPVTALDDGPLSADVTPEEQRAAAVSLAQRQLDAFTRSVMDTIAGGPDWRMWTRGVQSFVRRWESSRVAGRLALLRGVPPPSDGETDPLGDNSAPTPPPPPPTGGSGRTANPRPAAGWGSEVCVLWPPGHSAADEA